MQNIENWKKVVGYETYSVSDQGNVRNDKTGRILKFGRYHCGYLKVQLQKIKNHHLQRFIVSLLVHLFKTLKIKNA